MEAARDKHDVPLLVLLPLHPGLKFEQAWHGSSVKGSPFGTEAEVPSLRKAWCHQNAGKEKEEAAALQEHRDSSSQLLPHCFLQNCMDSSTKWQICAAVTGEQTQHWALQCGYCTEPAGSGSARGNQCALGKPFPDELRCLNTTSGCARGKQESTTIELIRTTCKALGKQCQACRWQRMGLAGL